MNITLKIRRLIKDQTEEEVEEAVEAEAITIGTKMTKDIHIKNITDLMVKVNSNVLHFFSS